MLKLIMSRLDKPLRSLVDTIMSIKDKKELEMVLKDLMTPQEIVEISERIQILKYLKQGLTQRDIAEKMGVSVTTVNRGSRILKYGEGGAEKVV